MPEKQSELEIELLKCLKEEAADLRATVRMLAKKLAITAKKVEELEALQEGE